MSKIKVIVIGVVNGLDMRSEGKGEIKDDPGS
jgi:hypothetical protein